MTASKITKQIIIQHYGVQKLILKYTNHYAVCDGSVVCCTYHFILQQLQNDKSAESWFREEWTYAWKRKRVCRWIRIDHAAWSTWCDVKLYHKGVQLYCRCAQDETAGLLFLVPFVHLRTCHRARRWSTNETGRWESCDSTVYREWQKGVQEEQGRRRWALTERCEGG